MSNKNFNDLDFGISLAFSRAISTNEGAKIGKAKKALEFAVYITAFLAHY